MPNSQGIGSPLRMPTGIAGFDEISDGGLPRGGVTVVIGGAGTGKTTFGLQVLACGARDHGEAGILVTFEESSDRLIANTAGFSWGGKNLIGTQVHVLDAQLSETVESGGDFELVGFLAILAAKAKQVGATRVVFDGLDVLLDNLGDAAQVRKEVFRLRDWVHKSGLSAIVTAKAEGNDAQLKSNYGFLQFLADCLVSMHHRVVQGTALRFLRVAKYRGAVHSANELPITITRGGLELAANTTVELLHPASTERISTGVQRLDLMLSNGYYRGSSVLITGAPGTAKTSLATAFAEAAVRRGERTLYISFDESPTQILRNVASIGVQLAPYLESGMLHMHSFRGRAESPEAHVARIRELIEETHPLNVIVDPLSALIQRGGGDSDFAALEVLDFTKSAGITLLATSLLGNALPLAEQTPLNISTIADTWMHVSYVSHGGERNRALTIVKARGTGHSNQVRELVLSDRGITLADVYSVGGEVLMGTLRWEKENEEKRSRDVAQGSALLLEQKAELALVRTKAQIETLVRERAVQEAELEQIKAGAVTDLQDLATEDGELRTRRRADPLGRLVRTAPEATKSGH